MGTKSMYLIVTRGEFLFILVLLPLFVLSQLYAADGSSIANSSIKGDPEKGEKLAIKKCDRCHGAAGISEDTDTPHLASQSAVYLLKQLKDYKSKERDDNNMYKRARKLSGQQMVDLSLWYEKQLLPEITPFSEQEIKFPQIVTQGDPDRSILACEICHGKKGDNVGGNIPKLAGQNVDYLISTMEYFRDGSRRNDQGGAVQSILKKLSDVEIDAIAHFYAALGRRPVE